MNPVTDPETGKRLRARMDYKDKKGKKGKWRNKRKTRNEKFWSDINANSL